MNNILLHLSTTNKIYVGICSSIVKYIDKNIYSTPLHNCIFDTSAECQADIVVLPMHEYTKEFHAFVSNTEKQVLLIVDKSIEPNFLDSVTKSLTNKKNILYVYNKPINENFILYNELYDDEVFFVQNDLSRNNKTAIILHTDEDINNKLTSVLYPHTQDIVCFNNQKFNHPTNLGSVSINELPLIFNEYSYVLDLSNLFKLEAMACGCKYIDNSKEFFLENIVKKKTITNLDDLSNMTFKNFVLNNTKLLEFLGA